MIQGVWVCEWDWVPCDCGCVPVMDMMVPVSLSWLGVSGMSQGSLRKHGITDSVITVVCLCKHW